MTARERLLDLARALEGEASVTVPRAWLLDALERDEATQGDAGTAVVDLTVGDVAARFGRKRSTIRGWCKRGEFPTAYRRAGKEWRIPVEAVVAYQAAQRQRGAPAGQPTGLGDWRTVRRAG